MCSWNIVIVQGSAKPETIRHATSFYVAAQRRVWLLLVYLEEDQLPRVYNLVVFDGVFWSADHWRFGFFLANKAANCIYSYNI